MPTVGKSALSQDIEKHASTKHASTLTEWDGVVPRPGAVPADLAAHTRRVRAPLPDRIDRRLVDGEHRVSVELRIQPEGGAVCGRGGVQRGSDPCDGGVEVHGPLGRVPGLVREVQPEEQGEVGARALVVLGVGGERVEGMRSDIDIRECSFRGLAVGAEARARAAGVGAGPVLLGLAPAPRLVVVWRVARAANTSAAGASDLPAETQGAARWHTHW